jgi:hypothetical protein
VGTDATDAQAEAVLDALDRTRVIIRVGHRLDPVAAVAAGALVSMVGRLHGNVEIDGDARCGANPWAADSVTEVLAAISDHRPMPSRTADADVTISFDAGPGDICAGGDDWTVRIGDEPSSARAESTGLGLHAAAAFAAAEAFKTALGPLGLVSLPARFEWNLLAHTFGHVDAPDAPQHHPQHLLFAGAGSVNSSAAALLMSLAPGRAVVVDPDGFDAARNPYRYPAAANSTTGPKASWVAGLLVRTGWDVDHHEATIGTWVTDQQAPGFDGIVISSVDSATGRGDVADILARTTLSGGVHGLALHIQREHCYDEYACPNCDFVDLAAPITQAQAVADMTGLELIRAAELIEGALVTEQDLHIAIASGRIAAGADLVVHRLADLIGRLYAEATVAAAGAEPVRVSAPFVSWITGALLAAEVAKVTCGVAMIDRRVELDMSGIPTGSVSRRVRDQSGRCTCSSPWRRRAAARLYGHW